MKNVHGVLSLARVGAPLLFSLAMACASSELPDPPSTACVADTDCPGGVCDLETGLCDRVTPPLDMDAGLDLPPVADMSEDLPPVADMNMPDLAMPDMAPDLGPVSEFSGCKADADCRSWQSCDVALGRCGDARVECTQDGECGSGACLAGRCAASCGPGAACPADLSCAQLDDTRSVCVALCDAFKPTDPCGPDLQCNPYFGSRGLCEGVGTTAPGAACAPDLGPQGCEQGAFCGGVRDADVCRTLCKTDAQCGAGETCLVAFGTEADTAGVCVKRCGAIGSESPASCAAGEGCQGYSSSLAVCLPEGSAQVGQRCTFDGSVYCKAGLRCTPGGPGALGDDPSEGVCSRQCVPGAAQTGCIGGELCTAFTDDAQAGVCRTTCNASLDDSSNGCNALLGRCLGLDADSRLSNTPATSGTCYPPGALANGADCELDDPLSCNADDICVDRASFFGSTMSSTGGQCTRSCVAYDYTGSPSRCAANERCAPVFAGNRIGFCSSANVGARTTIGASCAAADGGKWCNDSALCLDWVGTALTCQVVCFNDSSVCATGQQCVLIDPGNSELGYCR
jgi:hypothetical protein